MPDIGKNGYLCSSCEPVMLLVCYLFDVNIDHMYYNHLMKYRTKGANKTLKFNGNKSHMHSF